MVVVYICLPPWPPLGARKEGGTVITEQDLSKELPGAGCSAGHTAQLYSSAKQDSQGLGPLLA